MYEEHEILRMDAAQLAAWTRTPAPVGRDIAAHADASDARWCWGFVLALLALESWMRRPARTADEEVSAHAA
jgi:hypothetical protein